MKGSNLVQREREIACLVSEECPERARGTRDQGTCPVYRYAAMPGALVDCLLFPSRQDVPTQPKESRTAKPITPRWWTERLGRTGKRLPLPHALSKAKGKQADCTRLAPSFPSARTRAGGRANRHNSSGCAEEEEEQASKREVGRRGPPSQLKPMSKARQRGCTP